MRPCTSRLSGGWFAGGSGPLLDLGVDIVVRLILLGAVHSIQFKRRSHLTHRIAAPIAYRKARIARHCRERFIAQDAKLSQRFNDYGRASAIIVTVFDL